MENSTDFHTKIVLTFVPKNFSREAAADASVFLDLLSLIIKLLLTFMIK